jgi:predicted phosphodiesterase
VIQAGLRSDASSEIRVEHHQPSCIQAGGDLLSSGPRQRFNRAQREIVMAKGQMRSNKEKKKPKSDKNIKKGGATPSPFASGKTPAGQAPNKK